MRRGEQGALGVVLGIQLALGASPALAQASPPAPAAPPAVATPPRAAPPATMPPMPWEGPYGNARMVMWFTAASLVVVGSVSLILYVGAETTAQTDTNAQQQLTGGKSACNPAARTLPASTCMQLLSDWQARDTDLNIALGLYIPSAVVLASSMFLPWARDPESPAKHVFAAVAPGKSVIGLQGEW